MATVYTCTKPEEAWSLVTHFLGNRLLDISLACEASKKSPDDRGLQEDNEVRISRSRAQLISNLYMLVRNMNVCGYSSDAAKIQQILDMVTDQDVTRTEVREAIHAKNYELNARKREFDAAMAELRAKGAFQS